MTQRKLYFIGEAPANLYPTCTCTSPVPHLYLYLTCYSPVTHSCLYLTCASPALHLFPALQCQAACYRETLFDAPSVPGRLEVPAGIHRSRWSSLMFVCFDTLLSLVGEFGSHAITMVAMRCSCLPEASPGLLQDRRVWTQKTPEKERFLSLLVMSVPKQPLLSSCLCVLIIIQ